MLITKGSEPISPATRSRGRRNRHEYMIDCSCMRPVLGRAKEESSKKEANRLVPRTGARHLTEASLVCWGPGHVWRPRHVVAATNEKENGPQCWQSSKRLAPRSITQRSARIGIIRVRHDVPRTGRLSAGAHAQFVSTFRERMGVDKDYGCGHGAMCLTAFSA